jgi:L-alanine-DL-glutamate epimerase-like enolase superfamily enzyme
MQTIAEVAAHVRELRLRHPFATSRDRQARLVSRPIRIAVRLDDGATGLGEATPTRYVTGETEATVLDALARAEEALAGQDIRRLGRLTRRLAEALPHDLTARAGVEMALYHLSAQVAGESLWQRFGGAAPSIRTDVTLPLGADIEARVFEARAQGFDTFKVKVGPDLDADIRLLERISAAAPGARLRIDANQAFRPADALSLIEHAVRLPIEVELLEQPVPAEDLDALQEVAAASPAPVYADEAVRTPREAYAVLSRTQVAGINVKLLKSGVSGALDIVALARAAGRRLMIGCMLESRLGIGFSVAFACGTGTFLHADLDSHLLLAEEGPNPYFQECGPELRPG